MRSPPFSQVIVGQAALPRVVRESAPRGTGVQGADGVGRNRAEAHRRHVQQRHVVRLGAVRTADPYPRLVLVRLSRRGRGEHVLVADLVHVQLGAVGLLTVDALGPLVDHAAGVPVVGPTVDIALDEVLLDLGPDLLEQESHMTRDRVVAQDRVLSLHDVPTGQQRQRAEDDDRRPPSGTPDDCGYRGRGSE